MRLTWKKQHQLTVLERIGKIGRGLLALKEVEYLGRVYHEEDFGPRIERLIDEILTPLEKEWLGGERASHIVARVKALRAAILPDMVKGEIADAERERRWGQLADVYLAQRLALYPADYVGNGENAERLLETVERFEEDLTDKVRAYPPIKAMVMVDEAIEVQPEREKRGGGDPLMAKIEERIKLLLGIGEGVGTPAAAAVV
jgi:hypothetical protein